MGWGKGEQWEKSRAEKACRAAARTTQPDAPPAQYHGFFSQLACPGAPYVRNESPTVTRPHDDDDMADLAGTDT